MVQGHTRSKVTPSRC